MTLNPILFLRSRSLAGMNHNGTGVGGDGDGDAYEGAWSEVIRPVLAQILLFVLFLGLAAQIDVKTFKSKFTEKKKRRGVFAGVFCQFIVMPLLGLASVKIFDVDPVTGSVLLLITSSPGGALSNWVCALFNADLALSIALTTASSVCAFFMMPINAVLYIDRAYPHVDVPIEWTGAAIALAVVIVGVFLGMYLGTKHPLRRLFFHKLATVAGLLSIILSLVTSNAGPEAVPLWERDSTFFASISFVVFSGLAVGIVVSVALDLPGPQRMAVAIETMYQNLGIAVSASLTMFSSDRDTAIASGVPIFYGVLGSATNLSFCLICWKVLGWSLAPSSDGLCEVLLKSYQPKTDAPRSLHRNNSSVNNVVPSAEDGNGGGIELAAAENAAALQ